MLGFIRRTISRRKNFIANSEVPLCLSHTFSSRVRLWNLEPKISYYDKKNRRGTTTCDSAYVTRFWPYNERVKRLNLLPLVYRREVKDLSTFYKMKNGHFNSSFNSYFQFCSNERLRSHSSNKLKINRVRRELFKGTFFNRIPYLSNYLLHELTTANSNVSFKKLCTIFQKDKVFWPWAPPYHLG